MGSREDWEFQPSKHLHNFSFWFRTWFLLLLLLLSHVSRVQLCVSASRQLLNPSSFWTSSQDGERLRCWSQKQGELATSTLWGLPQPVSLAGLSFLRCLSEKWASHPNLPHGVWKDHTRWWLWPHCVNYKDLYHADVGCLGSLSQADLLSLYSMGPAWQECQPSNPTPLSQNPPLLSSHSFCHAGLSTHPKIFFWLFHWSPIPFWLKVFLKLIN